MTNTNRPIRRALVSVFHKEGIEVLAEAFVKAGTEVVSTGSTAKKLAELGVKVTEVSDVTGFPECLDGRVKTLHPYIHAGILADMTNPEHAKQLEEFGIKPFDLVVVNLYPFADTVRSGANEADTIEKIDIGGPSMVRGAAKNHATVAIVTDPADYALVASRVADGTGFSLELIRRYGIRVSELGDFSMEYDLKTPEQQAELANVVRFAIDRSRLTKEHLDYVIAAVAQLYKDRESIPNMRIVWGHKLPMRHFHAFLEPYPNEEKK